MDISRSMASRYQGRYFSPKPVVPSKDSARGRSRPHPSGRRHKPPGESEKSAPGIPFLPPGPRPAAAPHPPSGRDALPPTKNLHVKAAEISQKVGIFTDQTIGFPVENRRVLPLLRSAPDSLEFAASTLLIFLHQGHQKTEHPEITPDVPWR